MKCTYHNGWIFGDERIKGGRCQVVNLARFLGPRDFSRLFFSRSRTRVLQEGDQRVPVVLARILVLLFSTWKSKFLRMLNLWKFLKAWKMDSSHFGLILNKLRTNLRSISEWGIQWCCTFWRWRYFRARNKNDNYSCWPKVQSI